MSLRTPLFGPTSWWLGRDQIFFWPGVAYGTCDLGRISPNKKTSKTSKSQKENRWRNSCQVVLRNQVTSTGKDFVFWTFQQKLQGVFSVFELTTLHGFGKGLLPPLFPPDNSCYAKRWVPGSHGTHVFGSHGTFFSIKNSRVGQVVVSKYLLFSARKLRVSWSKLTIL